MAMSPPADTSQPQSTVLETVEALFVEGQQDRASATLQAHLRDHPDDAHGWALLGSFAYLSGDARHARSHTRRAISILDSEASFHQRMGLYLRALGRPQDAIKAIDSALARLRDAPDQQPARAAALALMGACRKELGDIEGAIAALREATVLDPNQMGYVSNLAIALADREADSPEALELMRQCCNRHPESADFHHNLGRLLVHSDAAEAGRAFQRAVQLEPAHEGASIELARSLESRGQHDQAMTLLDDLLKRSPKAHEARFNRGLLALRLERWLEGFADFETRYLLPSIPTPRLSTPRWTDADTLIDATNGPRVHDIRGVHLLVVAEQGLGDTLQFTRLISQIRGPDGPRRVTVAAHPRLHALMSGLSGVDDVVSYKDALPDHDVWTGTMSLPLLSGLPHRSDWALSPAFLPSPSRVERWKSRLPKRRRIRAAICWQGNPNYAADAERSIPLQHFIERLSPVPGIDLISLQAGEGTEQLQAYANVENLHVIPDALDMDGAFLDSAAILAQCDLLISSDTAMVHLAGAMDVTTWVALAHQPDWRWGRSGDVSPWYPQLRIFRQTQPKRWSDVFERMATALHETFL